MTISTKWGKAAASLCLQVGEEDGVDPRILAKKRAGKHKDSHKTEQLCKEAGRVVSTILMNQCGRPLLCDLHVVSVSPTQDGQCLCITVGHIVPDVDVTEREIVAELQPFQGLMRSAIAAAINRKHTPGLTFRYVGYWDENSQGGSYAD